MKRTFFGAEARIVIGFIVFVSLIVYIKISVEGKAKKELQRRGFIEMKFRGIEVFVLPKDVHLLVDGVEQ